MTSLASILHLFFLVFYSFSVPFSNVNGNTVAEESRLFFIPERVDLISLTISSQTLMHYTVGQQFIAWPRMQVMRVARERSSFHLNMNKCFNVSVTYFLCSNWHLFVFFILCLCGYVFVAHFLPPLGRNLSVHLHGYSFERLTLISFLTVWSWIECGQ